MDHHLLTSYQYAILSVVLAQFTPKGFIDGMEGIVRLVEGREGLQASIAGSFVATHKHATAVTCQSTRTSGASAGLPALCSFCMCMYGTLFVGARDGVL